MMDGYDEWPLSLALWWKFYNSHGKYKPELSEYFHMYQCQLNFSMFFVTSALGISWQHLNHPNFIVHAVYRFYVYFDVRLTLHELRISFNMKMAFSRLKMITRGVHITVSVTSMVLIQMKHGYMENGFVRQIMVFLAMKQRLQKDLHLITLHNG